MTTSRHDLHVPAGICIPLINYFFRGFSLLPAWKCKSGTRVFYGYRYITRVHYFVLMSISVNDALNYAN